MTWVDRMLSFRRTMAANQAFDGEHPLLAFARLQEPSGEDAAPAMQLAGGAALPLVHERSTGKDAARPMESVANAATGAHATTLEAVEGGASGASGAPGARGKVPVDRFGELDIITGHPVRDLKLDPVRQLVQWTGPLFGGGDEGSQQ